MGRRVNFFCCRAKASFFCVLSTTLVLRIEGARGAGAWSSAGSSELSSAPSTRDFMSSQASSVIGSRLSLPPASATELHKQGAPAPPVARAAEPQMNYFQRFSAPKVGPRVNYNSGGTTSTPNIPAPTSLNFRSPNYCGTTGSGFSPRGAHHVGAQNKRQAPDDEEEECSWCACLRGGRGGKKAAAANANKVSVGGCVVRLLLIVPEGAALLFGKCWVEICDFAPSN
mmetsp:Transcript_25124/g.63223  ORF Transcript_25124/g.63223 Transcript_25124/m.63223 type:complete len:227 (-) Transcript_25124:3921-4601(-)|eukprot:CAMPEP_0178996250 /NCGR_PEP_ID=MMETSP0795-20121207/8273_1 /TAXON_ID=88552 /ORGANISM="Amoebophrya sp., Strain Ameob2" /LENGTH=226 /DNA_ID=CAMNT_0020688637 /DNA_START=250 /DNA_END=930 /DNA_ORIENTATION=-